MEFEIGMSGKPIKLIDNGDETYSPKISTFQPFYQYELTDYIVFDSKNGKTLASSVTNANYLYIKEGDGKFIYKWFAPTGTIKMALITDSGAIIVWSNNGYVWRSTDGGVTFTEVLSGINALLHSGSRDCNGDTICFSTYTAFGTTDHIYTSTDDGVTWQQTLALPEGASHFHSCQYLHPRQKWIATTGDGLMVWYESSDGITWNEIVRTDDQRFRTLGISAVSRHEMLWSSDGAIGLEGVFYADTEGIDFATKKIETTNIKRNLLIPSTSYAFRGWLNVAMVGNLITDTNKRNRRACLYTTIDGGDTWQMEMSFGTTDPVHAGVYDIIGPNEVGEFYIVVHNINASIPRGTLIAKPNYEAHKRIV